MNQGAYVTLIGFVAREPSIRDVGGGVLVADVRIGTAGRTLDRHTGQWKDVEPQYFTVNCWRKMATYVNGSFHKGDPVYVRGRLRVRNFTDKQDRFRTEVEVTADVLGPDVSRVVAMVVRGEQPRRDIDYELARGEENRALPASLPDGPDDPAGEAETAADPDLAPSGGRGSAVMVDEDEVQKFNRDLDRDLAAGGPGDERYEPELAEAELAEPELA